MFEKMTPQLSATAERTIDEWSYNIRSSAVYLTLTSNRHVTQLSQHRSRGSAHPCAQQAFSAPPLLSGNHLRALAFDGTPSSLKQEMRIQVYVNLASQPDTLGKSISLAASPKTVWPVQPYPIRKLQRFALTMCHRTRQTIRTGRLRISIYPLYRPPPPISSARRRQFVPRPSPFIYRGPGHTRIQVVRTWPRFSMKPSERFRKGG